jgi:hypothetical protein
MLAPPSSTPPTPTPNLQPQGPCRPRLFLPAVMENTAVMGQGWAQDSPPSCWKNNEEPPQVRSKTAKFGVARCDAPPPRQLKRGAGPADLRDGVRRFSSLQVPWRNI